MMVALVILVMQGPPRQSEGRNCSLLLFLCGRAPKSEPQPGRVSGTIRGTITATDILPVTDEGRSGNATFYFVEGTGFKGTF
jgi:hypothetical protein